MDLFFPRALREQALNDLYGQNRSSILLLPLGWVVAVIVADLPAQSPLFFQLNSLLIALATGTRVFVISLRLGGRQLLPGAGDGYLVVMAMFLSGLHWSAMTVWSLLDPALEMLRIPFVMMAISSAAIGPLSLSPIPMVSIATPLVLTVPMAAVLLYSGERNWLLTVALATLFLANIMLTARRQRRGYQEAVQTATLLRQRTEELEHISSTDPVTQLRNRSHFDIHFELEWRRAHRQQYSLALLIIDLDHFKTINDQYGHLFGDHCLAAVADQLNRELQRSGDLLARVGGEEFALLLINTYPEGARQVAQQVCEAVAATKIDYQGTPIQLTTSVGLAVAVPSSPFGNDAQAFMHQADVALYQAKRDGRNRVREYDATRPELYAVEQAPNQGR